MAPRSRASSRRPLWIIILVAFVCAVAIGAYLYTPRHYTACYLVPSEACNSRPPPEPARVYTDDEIAARAIMRDIIRARPVQSKNPKIAFMFLTPSSLPFEKLWEKFFMGHEDRYTIYVHASRDRPIHSSPIFAGRDIRSEKVIWGTISMVDAEKRLLAHALQDPENQHFVLLSESCVPLHNFDYIYSYLMETNVSFVDCFDDPGPHGAGRYSDHMLPEIVKKDWRKGAQWFTVKRQHAILILADTLYYGKFKRYCKYRDGGDSGWRFDGPRRAGGNGSRPPRSRAAAAGGRRGRGGGMRGGAKVVVDPHKHEGVFIARAKEDALCTRNMNPGDSVYGEKRVSVQKEDGTKVEYRVWNPFRSKLAAAVLGGVDNIWIAPGQRVLYLGAASGTTVSHVSDIVGPEGLVYAVEFSNRSARDLVNMAKKRTNVIPIIEDARHPARYQMLVGMVDVIFSDVAQPDQANCIDCTMPAEAVFASEVEKLKSEQFKPTEQVTLEPFERDHACVIGGYRMPKKQKVASS